jgi:hypothetical protein
MTDRRAFRSFMRSSSDSFRSPTMRRNPVPGRRAARERRSRAAAPVRQVEGRATAPADPRRYDRRGRPRPHARDGRLAHEARQARRARRDLARRRRWWSSTRRSRGTRAATASPLATSSATGSSVKQVSGEPLTLDNFVARKKAGERIAELQARRGMRATACSAGSGRPYRSITE